MKKLISLFLMMFSLCSYAAVEDFEEIVVGNKASYINEQGGKMASLQILDPIINLSTTKQYAQYMMDTYRGWDLKAVVDLRGFAFKYVDNAPCSGLISYFDGRSYLFFQACGNFEKDELTALYRKANQALKVSEILKLQSRPNLY
ncbi:hypothetical protein SAMN02745213_00050 [Succinivibrio dextrinosolvens DSM 3072]|jgi:hypothetical protein|uniref:Uncharacterized protein n=1 Tax=Succinivibrio dextrinosolvens DSM 3072 TaxID=1123324 RepID=A0A1T4UVK2_9GAMM|nr:hypothetical protein [Succinivibrio dextrinosolvens]MBE6423829.1 hypothetical protein [Succinivibrio dextrinosolvens]SKA56645.1 hypothetical protein SAMN02745213_00050 [Succinivibrio dextrinosolvens DSM 3072]